MVIIEGRCCPPCMPTAAGPSAQSRPPVARSDPGRRGQCSSGRCGADCLRSTEGAEELLQDQSVRRLHTCGCGLVAHQAAARRSACSNFAQTASDQLVSAGLELCVRTRSRWSIPTSSCGACRTGEKVGHHVRHLSVTRKHQVSPMLAVRKRPGPQGAFLGILGVSSMPSCPSSSKSRGKPAPQAKLRHTSTARAAAGAVRITSAARPATADRPRLPGPASLPT